MYLFIYLEADVAFYRKKKIIIVLGFRQHVWFKVILRNTAGVSTDD